MPNRSDRLGEDQEGIEDERRQENKAKVNERSSEGPRPPRVRETKESSALRVKMGTTPPSRQPKAQWPSEQEGRASKQRRGTSQDNEAPKVASEAATARDAPRERAAYPGPTKHRER